MTSTLIAIMNAEFTCVMGGSYVSIWSKSISFSLSFGENKTASFTWIGSLNYPKSFSVMIWWSFFSFSPINNFLVFPNDVRSAKKKIISFEYHVSNSCMEWADKKSRKKCFANNSILVFGELSLEREKFGRSTGHSSYCTRIDFLIFVQILARNVKKKLF